jgi:hypothetical protein
MPVTAAPAHAGGGNSPDILTRDQNSVNPMSIPRTPNVSLLSNPWMKNEIEHVFSAA